MKITFISDTHSRHKELDILKGEILVHAGDITNKGSKTEIEDFIEWFKGLDFKYKIFIAGNHDFFLEEALDFEIEQLIPNEIIYLNDSAVEIEQVKFWGSPIQPRFHDWAFNRKRGKEIKKHWNKIPYDTDILITHGPPLNILDKTISNEHVGCEELLNATNLIKPKIHAFGHIHESYGTYDHHGTKFINASILDENYNVTNDPIEVTL